MPQKFLIKSNLVEHGTGVMRRFDVNDLTQTDTNAKFPNPGDFISAVDPMADVAQGELFYVNANPLLTGTAKNNEFRFEKLYDGLYVKSDVRGRPYRLTSPFHYLHLNVGHPSLAPSWFGDDASPAWGYGNVDNPGLVGGNILHTVCLSNANPFSPVGINIEDLQVGVQNYNYDNWYFSYVFYIAGKKIDKPFNGPGAHLTYDGPEGTDWKHLVKAVSGETSQYYWATYQEMRDDILRYTNILNSVSTGAYELNGRAVPLNLAPYQKLEDLSVWKRRRYLLSITAVERSLVPTRDALIYSGTLSTTPSDQVHVSHTWMPPVDMQISEVYRQSTHEYGVA